MRLTEPKNAFIALPPDFNAMRGKELRLVRAGTVEPLLDRVELALDLVARVKGLLGRRSLDPCTGMLFPECHAIHCFFMRFAIDVLFLDSMLRVVRLIERLEPWSAAACARPGTVHVLEAIGGWAASKNVRTGEHLELMETSQCI